MLTRGISTTGALLALALSAVPRASAQAHHDHVADSAAVLTVAHRFHERLAAGDSAGAVRLLHPELVVLESGGYETRAEYLGHHLGADMEFAMAVPSHRQVVSMTLQGDVAWIVSGSTTTGKFRERDVNSRGAELMILSRTPSGWMITAVHWSSRPRRPAG